MPTAPKTKRKSRKATVKAEPAENARTDVSTDAVETVEVASAMAAVETPVSAPKISTETATPSLTSVRKRNPAVLPVSKSPEDVPAITNVNTGNILRIVKRGEYKWIYYKGGTVVRTID